MTDKRIATIREALEKAIDNLSYYDGFDFGQWEKALAALNSLASEPCTDARELAIRASVIFGVSRPQVGGDPGNDPALDRVTALIQSAFDKIRRECADRAEKYLSLCGWESDGLTSAILSPESVGAEPVKKSKPYTDADELRGYIDAAGMFVYAPLAGDPCPHCGKTLINVSRYQDDPDWFPYCPHCERRSDVEYKDYSVETPAESEPERGPEVGDLVVWIYAGETHVKIADETLLDAFSIDPLEHQEIVIMRAAELQRRIEAER